MVLIIIQVIVLFYLIASLSIVKSLLREIIDLLKSIKSEKANKEDNDK